MEPVDTTNHFLVGIRGEEIIILRPVQSRPLTKAEALNLAAYLVALADDNNEFPDLLKAVILA